MSLQVWLPLNGDLHNQGLSPYNSTSTNYTVINQGKIGKCIKCTDSIDTSVPANGWDFTTTSISFGAWIKINKAELETKTSAVTYSSNYTSCGGTLLGNHGYGGFGLRWVTNNIYSSGSLTDVHIYANMRNTSSNIVVTSNYTVPFDTWTHVIVIFNREKETLSLYINGTLFQTKSSPIATYGTTGNIRQGNFYICQATWDGGNGNAMAGPWQLNDVRIYNHALSEKEVEEISKGLILHYPLNDRAYEQTTNLCTGLVSGGRTTVSNNIVSNTGENADTYWYIKLKEALIGGETYTLSCNLTGFNSPTDYISFGVCAQSGANSAGSWKIYNGYNTFTFTVPSGLNGSTANVILDDNGGTRTQIFHISNVQLEKKNHATAFVDYGKTRGSQYDPNIYIEPDGSRWIRIAHHNSPTDNGYFSRTDPWESGVYLNEHKWYCVNSAIEQISSYEFMVKQKTTSSATEQKWRWIQTTNPLIAVYNDVRPGTVTYNTSSGYNTSSNGGLWQMNSSARLCIANANSGNWYGAIGCWTAYQTNRIPGYPNTDITTGYLDLYIRIDTINLGCVYDSSGYNNNGIIVGSLTTITPSPRYSCATKMTNGQYIRVNNRPIACMPKDAITINLWQYATSWYNPISCTEGGGWNFENNNGIRFPVYISGVGYKIAQSSITPASTQNAWHMLTGTMDKDNIKIYYDGEEVGTVANGSTNGIGYANNYIFIGAEAQGDNVAPASSAYTGNLSDLRIYATALTAEQIRELYNTSMIVDGINVIPRDLE